MSEKILLQDILPLEELNKDGKILLVRHTLKRLEEMYQKNLIDEYQSFQSYPAFKKCKYIVSFLSGERNSGVFYGIFEVVEILEKDRLPIYSKELEKYIEKQNPSKDFYLRLKRI